MKNFKLFAILGVLAIGVYYLNDIIQFLTDIFNWVMALLTYHVAFGIRIWMIATWGIYKCSYFIWQKDGEDPYDMQETGREYRSMEEARYKEFKHQTQVENVGREVEVQNWTDKDGKWYFVIKVIHELGEFIFVPFKKG